MNIGDILYFAPGIRFSCMDLDGPKLPDQLGQRISGFYIKPAIACVDRGETFAAGVLLVSCIDALNRLSLDKDKVTGEDFKDFVMNNIPSCQQEPLAERLYDDVRCGLVHEARLKNGAQFSLEFDESARLTEGLLIVNPRCLAVEVQNALDGYIDILESDRGQREVLADRLKSEYEKDFIASGCAEWLEAKCNPEDMP